MRYIIGFCAVFFMLAAPVEAKQYHGTFEKPDTAEDPEKALDEESYRQEKIEKNSDGTEREEWQKDDAERRLKTGEGSSGPRGQENMFPNIGRKH